jgi:large subunit ribosomal protein L18
MKKDVLVKRLRRAKRVRAKISGTPERPRLAVFRSNKYLYLQLIDDEKGHTLVSASTRELGEKKDTKTDQARAVGELLAKKAIAAGIKKAVFSRGAYKYHGRVKAAAEGARSGGLII